MHTGGEVEIAVADVEKGGGAEGDDGRAHVRVGDNVDAEDVGDRALDVAPKQARDQDLAL